ncbi:Complex I intermediate-associated protein 30, mitochondrial [Neolecta irregularis DAH-3]|uniref:Complex I intermediate-associated protein 30, mitochondrial n=1 Tax=Neolecta irregularis (strain DAH-3) TaxID=1198029 RepID=A0A1U7LK95_NEOID|nr:Complex I intermediate-associated protein 30, mitochondrial [Neolecta irregularis DAH-3]|eukprot:OLL23086.1 Complex I intermediate-associated protein 30, mitochondrial [Neolecta irregularis DAH-3]
MAAGFFKRSANVFMEKARQAIRMDEFYRWDRELLIMDLMSAESVKNLALGCDRDIGGLSTISVDWDPNEQAAHFQGDLSLEIPNGSPLKRSGYSALRTLPPKPSIFGIPYWDTVRFRYLGLRVKSDDRNYFVNIQAESGPASDLYQHRLFSRKPGQWETVLIPFKDFVLTNNGVIEEEQVSMDRMKVGTVGISLLERKPGPYSLHIQWIKAVNTDDTHGDMSKRQAGLA